MSFQAMALVAPMTGLKTLEKFVLMMLANYASAEGSLFHSQSTLAADTAMTDRSVRTHLATLEARGLIRRTARYSRGSRTSDLILLTFIPEAGSVKAPLIPENYDRHTGRKRPLIPEAGSGEPILEPVFNLSARETALAPRDRAAPSPTPDEKKEVAAAMRELARSLGKAKAA